MGKALAKPHSPSLLPHLYNPSVTEAAEKHVPYHDKYKVYVLPSSPYSRIRCIKDT